MAAGEAAGFDADAFFQRFRPQIRAPGPRGHDGLHGVVAGVDAHFAVAHKGERPDIAFLQFVGLEGFHTGFGQLFRVVGHFHAENLGGIEQTLAVVLKAEYGRAAVGARIGANALKNGAAIVQGVGEHVHPGLIRRNHFTIKPNVLCCLHGCPPHSLCGRDAVTAGSDRPSDDARARIY